MLKVSAEATSRNEGKMVLYQTMWESANLADSYDARLQPLSFRTSTVALRNLAALTMTP